jgi:hypothetical protein
MDGLDVFYSDYQNRRIKVYGAVWLVLNQISGKPEPEMQKLIENWRKNADKVSLWPEYEVTAFPAAWLSSLNSQNENLFPSPIP